MAVPNTYNISVGADPEFFVRKKLHFISGHTFPVGTKKEPLKMLMGMVQADGIAIEINVTPSTTREGFVAGVRGAFGCAERLVKGVDKEAQLVARPSIFFGHKKLKKLPQETADLGCEPDFNAYELEMNPRPNKESPLRTGAGHIHIGWKKDANVKSREHIEECASLTKQLDYYLGLPSLIWDTDSRRRTLYGQAGAFRPKPYGVEYRVLSNKWTETEKHVGWVFDQTVKAFNTWAQAKTLDNKWDGYAMTAINSGINDWHKVSPDLAQVILK